MVGRGGARRAREALLLLAATPLLAAPPAPRSAERYKRWLEEDVVWIITAEERRDFLNLQSDPERDRFIDRFWEIRDPQPLTAENEFRAEHERRLAYADRELGSDSPRKGRLTERGRVYILLGKPDDVERVPSANEIYPHEMWFYGRNTARLGLPGQLRLIFYRPLGLGEYRLLNPVLDTDRLFPPSSQIDRNDPNQVRDLVGPEVAMALQSVAPGQNGNLSADIIHELLEPRKIPQRIREQGLLLHPSVKTRYSLSSLSLPLARLVVPLEDGTARVHLAAALPPAEVTFQEVESGRLAARVDAFGSITDGKGVVVASFDEVATLTLSRAELETRKGNAFRFEAVRKLVPGRYRVTLMLEDYTQGKLGRADSELEVPSPGARPPLSPFALASRVEPAQGLAVEEPFTFGGYRLLVPTDSRFQRGKKVYAFGLLRGAAGAQPDLDVAVELHSGTRTAFAARAKSPGDKVVQGVRTILAAVPTAGVAAGKYLLTVTLKDGPEVVASASSPLEVVEGALPDGFFRYSEKRSAPPEIEHYNRGVQLLSRGDIDGAEAAFRISLDHRKGFRPAMVFLARTLLLGGRGEEAAPLLEKVLAEDADNYDALVTRGSLLLGKADYRGAAASLERAIGVGARTKEVLNALGEAAIGLGDRAGARRWLEESLEMDGSQDAVRKRIEDLGS